MFSKIVKSGQDLVPVTIRSALLYFKVNLLHAILKQRFFKYFFGKLWLKTIIAIYLRLVWTFLTRFEQLYQSFNLQSFSPVFFFLASYGFASSSTATKRFPGRRQSHRRRDTGASGLRICLMVGSAFGLALRYKALRVTLCAPIGRSTGLRDAWAQGVLESGLVWRIRSGHWCYQPWWRLFGSRAPSTTVGTECRIACEWFDVLVFWFFPIATWKVVWYPSYSEEVVNLEYEGTYLSLLEGGLLAIIMVVN